MSSQALALVLTAALAHALWNFAAKRVLADGFTFVWCYVLASVVLWLPIAAGWLVFTHERVSWGWVGCAAATALLHIGYQLALQHGYDVGEMNLVYPLARGTGPLLTFLVAVLFLGDRPGLVPVLGVLGVIAGVLLISWERTGRGPTVRAGVFWGVATGVAIAAYTLWDNFAVNSAGAPPLPYFVLGMVIQLLPLSMVARARRARLADVLPTYRAEVVAVAVLSPLAYVLVLRALQLAPVALVAPARESSIVVGSLLG
ncbi:MAG: DMT family transporter, partial [Actinomycetota bacterium]|nr:DMT family transporter [Actinomycetota bacterium]